MFRARMLRHFYGVCASRLSVIEIGHFSSERYATSSIERQGAVHRTDTDLGRQQHYERWDLRWTPRRRWDSLRRHDVPPPAGSPWPPPPRRRLSTRGGLR